MSDLKISQLPPLTNPPSSDAEIIINDKDGSNFVTKRVTAGLLGVAGGSVTTFDPIIVTFGDTAGNYQKREIFESWDKRAPVIDWFKSKQYDIDFPKEATHFTIQYFAYNQWRYKRVESGSEMYPFRQYCRNHIDFVSGGQVVNAPDGSKINMSFTHNVTHIPGFPQDPYNDRYSAINNSKQKICQITANAVGDIKTVSLTSAVDVIMGGNNLCIGYLGDVVITPMRLTNISSYTDAINQFNASDPDEDIMPNYTATQEQVNKAVAANRGRALRKYGHSMITVIVDYLDSTPNISQLDEDNLLLYKARVNKVLNQSLDNNNEILSSAEDVRTELDVLYGLIGGIIATPFQFETDVGLQISDTKFLY